MLAEFKVNGHVLTSELNRKAFRQVRDVRRRRIIEDGMQFKGETEQEKNNEGRSDEKYDCCCDENPQQDAAEINQFVI